MAISHSPIADDHPIFIITTLAMFSRLPYHHPHADAYSWDLDQGYSCPDVLCESSVGRGSVRRNSRLLCLT